MAKVKVNNGWVNIKQSPPPLNKEVECRNIACGCTGRGYNEESPPNLAMMQILLEANLDGNYSQKFKWEVAEWRALIDSDD